MTFSSATEPPTAKIYMTRKCREMTGIVRQALSEARLERPLYPTAFLESHGLGTAEFRSIVSYLATSENQPVAGFDASGYFMARSPEELEPTQLEYRRLSRKIEGEVIAINQLTREMRAAESGRVDPFDLDSILPPPSKRDRAEVEALLEVLNEDLESFYGKYEFDPEWVELKA